MAQNPQPILERQLTVALPGSKLANVPVAVDLPSRDAPRLGVVLGHGAGGDLHSGHLPKVAAALAEAGFPCIRYTVKGPSVQRRVAILKELLLTHVAGLPGCGAVDRWVLAGHSMGGRVACQVACDLPILAAGCLLLSYPLHPPGKPAEVRDVPLIQLQLPLLFVRGTRDEFCCQQAWEQLLPQLQSEKWHVHAVDGGDHGLGVPGGAAAKSAALESAIAVAQRFLQDLEASQQLQEQRQGDSGAVQHEQAQHKREVGTMQKSTKRRRRQ